MHRQKNIPNMRGPDSKHMEYQRYTHFPHIESEHQSESCLEAMKIIKDAGGRIQKKKMAEEAEKRKIIIVNAKEQNFTQARFASLDKNIVQPLVETWGFVEVEKIGRNRWLKMTEDGKHAAEFLI